MRSKLLRPIGVGVLVSLGLAGCSSSGGTGAAAASTTPKALAPPAFVTVAPIATTPPTQPGTTIPGVTTVDGAQTYTVKAGDYLSAIAKLYGVKIDEIAVFNEWAEGAVLHKMYPGDAIKIPPGAIAVDPNATAVTPATTIPGQTSTSTAPGTTVALVAGAAGVYVVVAGDYLSGIAKKNGTTVDAIVAANGWTDGSAHNIFPGDKIKMPAKAG